MNSPQSSRAHFAFTLIELLVVITIIAILMGLLFPAINIVKEQARKAEAKAAVSQIAAAVKAYYTEYGKYPIGDITTSGKDVTYGEDGDEKNDKLFNILRSFKLEEFAANPNPRRIVFFEGKGATNPESPRGGFVPSDATKGTANSFVDPWGKQYCVVLDADYDNQLQDLPYSDFKGEEKGPRTGVGVYSLGKDGAAGDKEKFAGKYRQGTETSDDLISWQ